MSFSILHTGHVEIRAVDLERARGFYVDVLGMVETEREPGRIYLRGIDDPFHHCLTLRKANSPGLGHYGLRVSSSGDLDALEELHKKKGILTRKIPAGHEKGQGEALRVEDPAGFPVEFYHDMDRADILVGKAAYRQGIEITRIDHVTNCTPETKKEFDYYTSALGFAFSSYRINDKGVIDRMFLRRKENTHDLGFQNQPGPRNRHFALWVKDWPSIIRACDTLTMSGLKDKIEYGPGRHTPFDFAVYLHDTEGNRVELYHDERMFIDPEYSVVQRAQANVGGQVSFPFWGMPAPESYIYDQLPVESIIDGSLKPSTPEIRGDSSLTESSLLPRM